MSQTRLSIIIPHYDIPDLLIRCLRSIPVRDDIQVIVVDDCSPDANSYTDRIPELRRSNVEFLSTQQRGSAGRARNVGLAHAQGEWLTFVDADDLLPDDIETLYESLWQRPEELIFTDYRTVLSEDLRVESSRNQNYHNYFQQYFVDGEEADLRLKFAPMWGKLVRHQLVKRHQLAFDETRWSNDAFFSLKVGLLAKSIHVCRSTGYILTERKGSLTNDYCGTVREATERMEVALRMGDYLRIHNHRNVEKTSLYIDSVIYKRFGYPDRLRIAWRLRHHVRYALSLVASAGSFKRLIKRSISMSKKLFR